MLYVPTTIAEIDQIIKDEVQEDLHLDYKRSAAIDKAKRDEISKDVSAFANSDGGVLIYGIVEDKNLPIGNDGGVDHLIYSREWLEQVISSKITPRVDGIRIVPIPLSADRSIYVVEIPKSFRGPHQSSYNIYYKRFNFQSVPMEDYEITDIRNRHETVSPLVDISVRIRHKFLVYLNITNSGEQTAEDVVFEYPNDLLPWIEKQKAKLFTRGIKYLPAKRTYSFMYDSIQALVHEGSKKLSTFDITVSYLHPKIGQRISDTFHIDFMDYWGSSLLESELYEHGKEIKESIKKLTDEVTKLNSHLSRIVPISGSTGLDLSITTLKNLKHIIAGDDELEKIDPAYLDYDIFMEVLGVDSNTALQLRDFFSGNAVENLSDVDGMTEEIIEKIKKYFILRDKDKDAE